LLLTALKIASATTAMGYESIGNALEALFENDVDGNAGRAQPIEIDPQRGANAS